MVTTRCTICQHPDRVAIETELAGGASHREVAARYGVSLGAIGRHKAQHGGRAIVPHRGAVVTSEQRAVSRRISTARAVDLYERLADAMTLVDQMKRACERYLGDPDRDGELTLDPHAREVTCIYLRPIQSKPGELRWVPQRAVLQDLVDLIETSRLPHVDGPVRVARLEYKHADPRKLILAVAGRVEAQVRVLGLLVGELSSRDRVPRAKMNELVAGMAADVEAVVHDPVALEEIAKRWKRRAEEV